MTVSTSLFDNLTVTGRSYEFRCDECDVVAYFKSRLNAERFRDGHVNPYRCFGRSARVTFLTADKVTKILEAVAS